MVICINARKTQIGKFVLRWPTTVTPPVCWPPRPFAMFWEHEICPSCWLNVRRFHIRCRYRWTWPRSSHGVLKSKELKCEIDYIICYSSWLFLYTFTLLDSMQQGCVSATCIAACNGRRGWSISGSSSKGYCSRRRNESFTSTERGLRCYVTKPGRSAGNMPFKIIVWNEILIILFAFIFLAEISANIEQHCVRKEFHHYIPTTDGTYARFYAAAWIRVVDFVCLIIKEQTKCNSNLVQMLVWPWLMFNEYVDY